MSQSTAHHVGITVDDLDAMAEFYAETLNLPVAERFRVEGEGFATAVDVEGASADFVHFDADGCRIELCEYQPQDAAMEDPAVNRPGAVHLGIEVDDVQTTLDRVPADGETLSDAQTTDSGAVIGFIRDPEGNLIEVLEP